MLALRQIARPLSPYSPELTSVIARAVSEGFPVPPSPTLSALDVFYSGLVADGIFSKLDYIRVSAYNDVLYSDFARINAANASGVLATIVNAMTFTINGFKGDKVSAYIDTGIDLSTTIKYTQNSATRLYVLHSASTNSVSRAFDGVTGSTANQLMNSNSTGQRINQGTSVLSSAADLSGTGLKAIVRTSPTNVELYSQATQYSRTATSVARINRVQLEFRSNNVFSDHTSALSLYGAQLSSTEIASVRSRFNTYLTTIGLTAFA